MLRVARLGWQCPLADSEKKQSIITVSFQVKSRFFEKKLVSAQV